MSFGLLTAIGVDDIPKILQRCAHGWRGGVYSQYPGVWLQVANEVDRFATELAGKIRQWKNEEPKKRRPRVSLDDLR